jgi:iron complex outermembrane receptor protein
MLASHKFEMQFTRATSGGRWKRHAACRFIMGFMGLIAIGSGAASAQVTPAATGGPEPATDIQEIVVTASKREESLSKTPLAVSVLSQAQLTQDGIMSAKELTHAVPNLALAVNGVGDAVVVNLRGIQSSNIFPDGDPAVAVYVDGVNIPRTQGLNGDLYDLARVEVLRGPQGTLYGRNATAGSINIITAPPSQELSGHIDASIGAYTDVAAHGFINVPVTETFAVRAAFSVHRNDGYFDNRGSVDQNYDRANDLFGRITALWKPSERFSWQLAISDFNSLGTSNPGIATNPEGKPADGLPVFDRLASPTPEPYDHVNTLGVRSRMDLKLNDSFSLAYVAGYGRVLYANRQVTLGSPLPYVIGLSNADIELSDSLNENYSHELDLSFDREQWHNILGATYFHERNHNIANFTVYNFGIDYDFTIPDTRQESFGVFDQATYEIRPGLRLIGGLRYSHDAKNKDGEFISFCPPLTPYNGSYSYNPACFVQIPDAEQGSWSKVTWKVGVDMDLGTDSLLFASVATGYKAGGLSDANAPGQLPPPYQPENVTNYELGFKTKAYDSRLQLNADVFYMNYKNLQVTQVQQPIGQLTANAAAASIYGAELEATWVATPQDKLTGFLNFLHATYRRFNDAVDSQTSVIYPSLAGNSLPQAPKLSARLRYQHDWTLPNGATLSPAGSVYYQGHVFLREFNLPIDRVEAYTKSAASLLFKSPAGKWSVEAYGENLENKHIRTAQFVLAGTYLSYYDPPRTYGVRFSRDF